MTDATNPPPPEGKAAVRRFSIGKGLLAVLVGLVLVLAGLAAGLRYGAVTQAGRGFITQHVNGLKLGRVGRLSLQGLDGDIFRDFTIARLAIVDEKGAWVEARRVHVVWRLAPLLTRRFQAERIDAAQVTILRRPTLTPKEPPGRGMPVSVDIDAMAFRLEMAPAFSARRGVYDVAGALHLPRAGGQRGKVAARSLLHPGDFLDLDFDLNGDKRLFLKGAAQEASGGALAGALGLPADQPFQLDAQADGKMSQGRFTLTARSGARTPIQAQGAWTSQGGHGQGFVRLDASSLLTAPVRMFGPQADFVIDGRKRGDGFFDIAAKVTAQNLLLTAQGPADLGKRKTGPKGVGIAAEVADMSRIIATPALGRSRFDGLLTGNAKDLRLAGEATAQGAQAAGFTFSRLAGPVTLSLAKGEAAVEARLSGDLRSGPLYNLLGAKPSAWFEGARLKDGRMLIRRLRIDGAAARVDAVGERTLLGGLSFKGQAAASDMARLRPGAAGGLEARWSASQARADRPWTFTLDAQGRGFKAGLGELDRLLGERPRLSARAAFHNGQFDVAGARLDAAAAKASASGVLAKGGGLNFKLDWSADGPFRAGPVEITGKASGDGTIGGSVSAPRADLNARIAQIDLPQLKLTDAALHLQFARSAQGGDGAVDLTAASEYGPARARTDFKFIPGGVSLSGLDVAAGGLTAKGAVALQRGAPSSADLAVTAAPGALLTRGKLAGRMVVVDAAGGPRARLDLTGGDLAFKSAGAVTVGHLDLTADGPISRLPFTLKADGQARPGAWSIAGDGRLETRDPGYALVLNAQGKVARAAYRTSQPAQAQFGGGRTAAQVKLEVGRGAADIDIDLTGQTADVQARLTRVGLGLLNEDLAGQADVDLRLQGRGGDLSGDMTASVTDARQRGEAPAVGVDATLKASLRGDGLSLQGQAQNGQGLKSAADLRLPVETSGAPLRLAINRQRPMQGRFTAQGEIKGLWDLLIGGQRSLSGMVDVDVGLGGTLADPRLTGQASLANGRFEDGPTGLRLQNVAVRAALADNAVDISQATAADGQGGALSGGGRVDLRRNAASTFRLDMTKFRLIDNDLAQAEASGQATVERAADGKLKLTGDLVIDRADVSAAAKTSPPGVVVMDVVEINKPGGQGGLQKAAPPRSAGMTLDVKLSAPRHIFVRGRGLDVELSLDAHVGGTSNAPTLDGVARVVRGDYDFAGKRFEFDQRGVIYLSAQPSRIRLDLSATRDDPSLTAVVKIQGTALRPEITLSSTPALPQDEILSQVLFGASAAQLSPLEAAQLASALSSLAGGGGFDVIGNLRSFAGLDRLSFAGDAAGVSVAGGKYLTDDVYLEVIGGGREGPAVQVEWRVRRALAIVSRLSSQGDSRLSVRWRKDY